MIILEITDFSDYKTFNLKTFPHAAVVRKIFTYTALMEVSANYLRRFTEQEKERRIGD